MRVIVTGATGFLGSKVIKKLIENDVNIISFQRSKSNNKDIEFAASTLCEIKKYIKDNNLKVDKILYMACQYDKGNNINDVYNANLTIPLTFLDLSFEFNISDYIYIGTSLPKDVNYYSYTKKMFSESAKTYCEKRVINFYNIELESFFSSDEPDDRFIKRSILKLKEGKDIPLTEGLQKRDYIHIDEVVSAIIDITNLKLTGYHDIPIGSGVAPTIREIMEYLKDITNSNSQLLFGEVLSRKHEPDCVADIDKMKQYNIKTKQDWKSGFLRVVEELK